MEEVKICGNCFYADYYRRHQNARIDRFVECEYYSTKKESREKACANWKEKKCR